MRVPIPPAAATLRTLAESVTDVFAISCMVIRSAPLPCRRGGLGWGTVCLRCRVHGVLLGCRFELLDDVVEGLFGLQAEPAGSVGDEVCGPATHNRGDRRVVVPDDEVAGAGAGDPVQRGGHLTGCGGQCG